ncbi:MAG: polymorphic toxin type 15 domain-containing protein [Polyangiaceae bacterium]
MAWEAILAMLPPVLIRLLIEKLVAVIVPAAGALLAIVEGLQAAWGTISSIISAIDKFITFLKAVKGGGAGAQFAAALASAAIVVLDFVANFLIAKLASGLKKLAGKLGGIAKRLMKRRKAAGGRSARKARRNKRKGERGPKRKRRGASKPRRRPSRSRPRRGPGRPRRRGPGRRRRPRPNRPRGQMSPQAIIARVLTSLSRPARAKTPELGIKEKQVQAALLRAQLQRRAPKGRTLKIRIETSPSDVEKDGYIDFWVSMSPERHGKAKARSRMRQVTVNFLPHTEQHPDWRKDYLRQIRGQERGINAMTVGRWTELRSLFLARSAATGSGRHDQSDSVQQRARTAKLAELRQMLVVRLVPYYMSKHGMTRPQAIIKAGLVAKNAAEYRFRDLAALHDPDQIAGGNHDRIGGVPIDEFTRNARDRAKQLEIECSARLVN